MQKLKKAMILEIEFQRRTSRIMADKVVNGEKTKVPFIKTFFDYYVTSSTPTGVIRKDKFTAHTYRGELRVIIPPYLPTARYMEAESSTIEEFKQHCQCRWPTTWKTLYHMLVPSERSKKWRSGTAKDAKKKSPKQDSKQSPKRKPASIAHKSKSTKG